MIITITKNNGMFIDEIEISDQDLIKLGRKYFELVSGNSTEKETTFNEWKEKKLEEDPEFKKECMMLAAKELKEHCKSFISCKTCPFCMNPDADDGGGIYKCKLRSSLDPSEWEV